MMMAASRLASLDQRIQPALKYDISPQCFIKTPASAPHNRPEVMSRKVMGAKVRS